MNAWSHEGWWTLVGVGRQRVEVFVTASQLANGGLVAALVLTRQTTNDDQ